ncbi:MAG: rhodanese-like domain-containing protein [Cyanobacteriota bacterium]
MKKTYLFTLIFMGIFSINSFAESKGIISKIFDSKTKKSSKNDKIEISTIDVKKALTKKDYVLIDVREKDEYDSGHIQDVKLISMGDLDKQIPLLDKKMKYIAVCRSGVRSLNAAKKMRELGLKAYTMTGGMNEWASKGFPIKK